MRDLDKVLERGHRVVRGLRDTTKIPRDGPDRLVNLERILSEKARGADTLHVASRVRRDEAVLPSAGLGR